MDREVGGGGAQARQIPGSVGGRRHDAGGTQGVPGSVGETRKTSEYEWETLWSHDEYVRNFEADREALVDPLEGLIYFPQTLTLKTSGSSSLRGALYGDYFRVASLRIGQNSRIAMSNVPSFYS